MTKRKPEVLEEDRRFYTPKEVSVYFHVHYETISRAIQAGKIQAIKTGRVTKISKQEFEKLKIHGWSAPNESVCDYCAKPIVESESLTPTPDLSS